MCISLLDESLAITHSSPDFIKSPRPLDRESVLVCKADVLKISGIREDSLTFQECDHTQVHIITHGYYVPKEKASLLSRQPYSTSKIRCKVLQG